jgi:membrane protease YdiL (CAAX protease family)
MSGVIVVGRAVILGILISSVAGGIWTALLVANVATTPAVPWSVAVMGAVLWFGWRYLGGSGPPRGTQATRRRLLRANAVRGSVFAWALLSGTLGVVGLAGLWIVVTQLFPMAANALPSYSAYPALTVALAVAMGSLVSPLSEEAGFRGYCQLALERQFGRPAVAILASSLAFTIPHIPVAGLFLPKLFVYFVAGILFGAIAYLANSILASIPVHVIGDATFFTFVWPFDATRPLVTATGADAEFWVHVAQVVVFGALSVLAFVGLRRARPSPAPGRPALA